MFYTKWVIWSYEGLIILVPLLPNIFTSALGKDSPGCAKLKRIFREDGDPPANQRSDPRLFSKTWGRGSFWFQVWIHCANVATEARAVLWWSKNRSGMREQRTAVGKRTGKWEESIRMEGHWCGWGGCCLACERSKRRRWRKCSCIFCYWRV